jgi:drug/metabolite transporter (DMT)-like permease
VVWGALVFHEGASPLQLAGCALVVAGVALFALADGEGSE